ncbi:WG repeat-containing protein [Arcticibacter sp. MXS-1]|uniref:WG repeat-containing protein n=1 Tax=Arcticibacter sp. MXS-1 TaxID=3341726 RepID=UPI0035A8D9F8
MNKYALQFLAYFCFVALSDCRSGDVPSPLVLKRDTTTSMYAYFDEKGNKVLGDYYAAYTDTITEYGIVADPGFVLIDKTGKHIYNIYPLDNGPDYTSEGTYRIIENGKIGYVDSLTSEVLIQPKFDCAYPFENGKAKVSVNCRTVKAFPGDEHSTWESKEWFYVDKTGKVVR